MWLPFTSRTLVRGLHRRCARARTAHPGAGRVDHRARVAPIRRRSPARSVASHTRRPARARAARSACASGRVAPRSAASTRVQHHQPRIVRPGRRSRRSRAGSAGSSGSPAMCGRRSMAAEAARRLRGARWSYRNRPARIIHAGPQVRVVRHDEVQRPDDVRRGGQQHLALHERLAHQREVQVLQVAQAAVDQLGAGRGGVRGQIVLLAQHDTTGRARRHRARCRCR